MPGFEDVSTLAALFVASAARHGARPMLGERPTLSVSHDEARGGRKLERRAQGEYAWMSYSEARAPRRARGAHESGSIGQPRVLTRVTSRMPLAALQALEQASAFGAGVRSLGLPAHAVVAIFADTSPHWLLAAYGCFLEARTDKTSNLRARRCGCSSSAS